MEIIDNMVKNDFEYARNHEERWNSRLHKYIKLKYMSDEWIQSTIDWFVERKKGNNDTFQLFLEEKLHRSEKEIYITDLDMMIIHYPII